MPGRDTAGSGTDGAGASGGLGTEPGRTPSSAGRPAPAPGRIAFVRQRRWLVEEVAEPGGEGEATLVHLSCLDDDAQGQPLAVLWEHELDARVLEDDGWRAVAGKGFDEPALFAAYLWLGRFAPQSLLILDETHHAAPSSGARYAIDSQTTRAVRDVAPRFEHRLFLSATPHNGHSNSFSALLEILDPQRFCRGVKVLEGQLDDVMVRRLKSDVRALEGGFPKRTVVQIDIAGLPPAPTPTAPASASRFSPARPPPQAREEVKHAFNTEPKDHPLRILIATDAAREGLNLQRHCADLFHFDLPWNPSRLDQRNGRIDRKLQPAGEVFCRYFFYRQRPEDRVLKVLVEKAERIRAELGSAATVLEGRVAESMGREGVRRDRLAELADSIERAAADDRRKTVEEELEDVRARRDGLRETVGILERRLERSRRHIGLTAAQFRRTLSVSLRLAGVPGGIRELPGRRQRSVLAVHDRPIAVDAGAGTPRSGDRPPSVVYGFKPSVTADPADPAGLAGDLIDGEPEAEYAGAGTPRSSDRPPSVVYSFEPPVTAGSAGLAGDLIDGGPETEYDVPHRPLPTFEFPAHRILVRDPGWTAALDTLRERRRRGESPEAWRRRTGVRPVAFEDTGRLGDKAVHLHLEHRVAQRLLSRFTAQGLIHHDLSKACLAATPGRDTRVVLLGRLAVYGRHAARLHEEVVPVTARWIDPARRSGALAPYGRAGEQTTLAALQTALDEAGDRRIPEPVQARFAASAEDDIRDLKPHLQRRADGLIERVKAQLAARAEAESDSMRALLERQHARIVGAVRESRQMAIGFDAAERRQHEADRRAWDRRLKQIEEELESEPRRIAETWTVRAVRVDPVGIVYLWPPEA